MADKKSQVDTLKFEVDVLKEKLEKAKARTNEYYEKGEVLKDKLDWYKRLIPKLIDSLHDTCVKKLDEQYQMYAQDQDGSYYNW